MDRPGFLGGFGKPGRRQRAEVERFVGQQTVRLLRLLVGDHAELHERRAVDARRRGASARADELGATAGKGKNCTLSPVDVPQRAELTRIRPNLNCHAAIEAGRRGRAIAL